MLGRGGFATVWEGEDLSTGSRVALKLLDDADDATLRRFEREAAALLRIRHENCVRVLDHGVAEGRPFLVLELIEGTSLTKLRGQRLPASMVIDFARQLSLGLAAAHAVGVTHRDLKPENVIQRSDGTLKILDFGIAKVRGVVHPDVTKTGELIGTPQYASPEQLRGAKNVGPATDQYALGVMLFELLEGSLPFRGSTLLELAMAHLNQPVPPITRPDCPDALRACVARLLAKQPEQRFGDVKLVARMFQETAPVKSSTTRSSAPVLAFLVGACAVAAALLTLRSATAPEPDTRTIVARALAAPPSPATEPRPAPVVAQKTEEAPPLIPDCGVPGKLGAPDGRSVRYLPTSYQAGRRSPVMLFLTGNDESPSQFIVDSRLNDVAESHSIVIVAPHDKVLDGLLQGTDWRERLFEVVKAQTTDLCVDLDHVIVVGQHDRARWAIAAGCADWAGAVIHHALDRFRFDENRCDNGRVVPELSLSPVRSPRQPVEGGAPEKGCGKRELWSLNDFDTKRRHLHGCEGAPVATEHPDGVCYRQNCDIPLVSCHIEGSVCWPGTDRALSGRTFECGDLLTSDFPAHIVVDSFLQSLL